jgi:hypothetical protein
MGSKALQRAVLLGFVVLPLQLAGASNPHTVDGQDCSAWRPTAPLSERIRQVRSCENFEIANAYKLAEEFETGSNGLPKDWGSAATWYRETIKLAEGVSQESMGARRAEAARQRLAELLQTGGPGLQANPAEAQRLMPIDIQPGFWEFTSRATVNGEAVAMDNDGRYSVCLSQDDIATESPFAVAKAAADFRAAGCAIEELQAGSTSARVRFNCETYYDEEWDEAEGNLGTLIMRFSGDNAEVSLVETSYPVSVQTVIQTTGRRTRGC